MTNPITPPPELAMHFRGVPLIPPLDCTDPQSWIAEQIYQMGAALVQPEPVAPTDEEIEEAAKLIHASMRFAVPDNHYTRDWVERGNSLMQDEARRTARAALTRYARPTIQPVSVSERLPGPEDCDGDGRCWWFMPEDDEQPSNWCQPPAREIRFYGNTHWLPYHALPTPEPTNV